MQKFTNKLLNVLASHVTKTSKINPEKNHLIFSDPRGGSTWLMELIQSITNEPVVWEPLHLGRRNNPFLDLHFSWRQYIPEDQEWKEAKILFDDLFSANILRDRIKYQPNNFKKGMPKSLLFKFCRGNALLPWLVNNYGFLHLPIYLIRHPFAIVSSQLRHQAWGDNYFTSIIEKPYHFDQLYSMHSSFLKGLNTKEEVLTAQWCLSNYPALNSESNNKKWITITYEDLVLNPKETLERVINIWSIKYDISQINFQKDSSTTQEDSPKSPKNRIGHWKEYFSKDQIDRMGRVLEVFDINVYSKENPLPHHTV